MKTHQLQKDLPTLISRSPNRQMNTLRHIFVRYWTVLLVLHQDQILGEPARGVIMITILSIKAEVLCHSIVEILNPVETSLMVCVPVAPDFISSCEPVDDITYAAIPAISTMAIKTIIAPIPISPL